jgi:hypothetical protein
MGMAMAMGMRFGTAMVYGLRLRMENGFRGSIAGMA